MPIKLKRVLGVGMAALLSFVLLVFFASIFFASRHMSYSGNDFGGTMMFDGADTVEVPGMMRNSFRAGAGDADRIVAEKSVVGSMMGNVSAPTMMVAEKKIIKNGSLNLRVQNVDEALVQIGKITEEMGGDIFDSHFNQVVSGVKSGTVTVKVPVDKFGEAFAKLKGVATVVLSEAMSGADVTEQYIDLQARINNKKAAEITLQTLFERAVKISDVIEVTDKLTVVRGEIESLEGQLRYLSSQTDRASITLSLTEDTTVVADQGFRPVQTLKESIVALIRMLGNFTEGIIRLLVVGFPIVLAYGVILWLVYRLARKIVRKFWPGSMEEKKRILGKR